jgi:hypothetical protein
MTARTRPAWVETTAEFVGRIVDGARIVACTVGRFVRDYLRTCPVQDDPWYWRAAGYSVWGIVLAVPAAPVVWLGWVVVTSGWPVIALGAGWWIALFWVASRPADGEPKEAPEEEETPAATDDEVRAATLQWVRDAIGDRLGVHLSELLANGQQHGLFQGLDVAAFRALLEGWGIPTEEQLKVGGKNRRGVRATALPPAPSPAEAEADLPEPLPAA